MVRRTGPDPVRQDLAYRLLNGFLELEGAGPASDQELLFLTEVIYQHRVNLCERAGLELEDRDLEAIVTAYERMNRRCAELMYNQGWYAGNRTYEVYELQKENRRNRSRRKDAKRRPPRRKIKTPSPAQDAESLPSLVEMRRHSAPEKAPFDG